MGAGPVLALGALGIAAAFAMSGKKKGSGGAVTPLPPQDGGLMLGQRSDGVIVVRIEARAMVIAALHAKFVGMPQTNGQVTVVPLGDGGQNAAAWLGMETSRGRNVAISYEGTPRLASFPAGLETTVCREGAGLALLAETTPAGGGISPPPGATPAGGSPGDVVYPPGDIPLGGGGGAPPPAGGGGSPFPGIPPGWLPPGFPGATPPTPPATPPGGGGGAPPAAPPPVEPPGFPGGVPGFPGGVPGFPGGVPGGGVVPPVEPPAAARTYTIRSGDTGMKLAQRGTGSVYRWREIGAANPQLRPVDMSGNTVTDGSPSHAGYLPWYAGQTVITVPPGWGPL